MWRPMRYRRLRRSGRRWMAAEGSHRQEERPKMRRVIVSTYATLDGRVDDIRDWALPYNDGGAVKYHTDLLTNCDGLLLGRKTYEIFAAVWPSLSGQFPYVDKMNTMATYVASATPPDPKWVD